MEKYFNDQYKAVWTGKQKATDRAWKKKCVHLFSSGKALKFL